MSHFSLKGTSPFGNCTRKNNTRVSFEIFFLRRSLSSFPSLPLVSFFSYLLFPLCILFFQFSHFFYSDYLGTANPANPVVYGGQLFNSICDGVGKHCQVGMVDEGTPDIVMYRMQSEQQTFGFHLISSTSCRMVEKGFYYVTFHGYDYVRNKAARGVGKTDNFIDWITLADDLPGGKENRRKVTIWKINSFPLSLQMLSSRTSTVNSGISRGMTEPASEVARALFSSVAITSINLQKRQMSRSPVQVCSLLLRFVSR